MGNSLRCCLACILPCGALDVIRIVHLNGQVEELSHPILVKEVINANPNHVLTMPCPQGLGHKILILSPNSELKRGHFYFLIPASSIPNNNKSTNTTNKKKKPSSKLHKIKNMEEEAKSVPSRIKGDGTGPVARFLMMGQARNPVRNSGSGSTSPVFSRSGTLPAGAQS